MGDAHEHRGTVRTPPRSQGVQQRSQLHVCPRFLDDALVPREIVRVRRATVWRASSFVRVSVPAMRGVSLLLSCFLKIAAALRWPVTVVVGGQTHILSVSSNEPVLAAVERAGLLPDSSCRRGACLSCAARVLSGSPWSLRVDSSTALCSAAHEKAPRTTR